MTLRTIAPPYLLSGFMVITLGLASALWIAAVPSVVSMSTFGFLTVFVVGAGMVTLMSWENAQPPSIVGQLLYATEVPELSRKRISSDRD